MPVKPRRASLRHGLVAAVALVTLLPAQSNAYVVHATDSGCILISVSPENCQIIGHITGVATFTGILATDSWWKLSHTEKRYVTQKSGCAIQRRDGSFATETVEVTDAYQEGPGPVAVEEAMLPGVTYLMRLRGDGTVAGGLPDPGSAQHIGAAGPNQPWVPDDKTKGRRPVACR